MIDLSSKGLQDIGTVVFEPTSNTKSALHWTEAAFDPVWRSNRPALGHDERCSARSPFILGLSSLTVCSAALSEMGNGVRSRGVGSVRLKFKLKFKLKLISFHELTYSILEFSVSSSFTDQDELTENTTRALEHTM